MYWDCERRRAGALIAMVLLASSVIGCSDRSSPEDRIRTLIGDVETAVEARSAKDAAEHLHAEYRDQWHPDKRTAMRSLLGYLLRHKSIHLLTVTKEVSIDDNAGTARAVVFVAMTGTPVESIEALVSVKADLLRFDVELISTGDEWQVVGSAWRRVDLAAF